MFVKRHQQYHHAKSDHVDAAFKNLEFFYNADMTGYYTYFDSHPNNWDMSCIIEYLRIPKEIEGEVNVNNIIYIHDERYYKIC